MGKIDFTMTPGNYVYGQDAGGKYAYGVVRVGATSERDSAAQRSAGGAAREDGDHGGHLIAHCLGGRNDASNLDAQNANVNQRGQRHVEKQVAELAKDPNKTVYMSVENSCSNGSERPDAAMITVAVLDNTSGQVDVQYYSLQNASYDNQAEWDAIANENAEIDPRQDIGMTAEERALANEYADTDVGEDVLGEGRAFFSEEATPIMGELGNDSNSNGNTVLGAENDTEDGASLNSESYVDVGTVVDDGTSLDTDNDTGVASSVDDGGALDVGKDMYADIAMDDGVSLDFGNDMDIGSAGDDGVSLGGDTTDGATSGTDGGMDGGDAGGMDDF